MRKIILGCVLALAMLLLVVGCAKESVEVVDDNGNFVGNAVKLSTGGYKITPMKTITPPVTSVKNTSPTPQVKLKSIVVPKGDFIILQDGTIKLSDTFLSFLNTKIETITTGSVGTNPVAEDIPCQGVCCDPGCTGGSSKCCHDCPC
jgi:hypothetical protein